MQLHDTLGNRQADTASAGFGGNEEAQRLISSARDEAAKIVEDARKEAESILAVARKTTAGFWWNGPSRYMTDEASETGTET